MSAREFGICPCGISCLLIDGACSRCWADHDRLADDGAPPLFALEEELDYLENQDDFDDEMSRDNILEQQELEDFEGYGRDEYYGIEDGGDFWGD